MEEKAVLARVTGRVQGVSYRVWARSEAEAIGVSGWVRNERDGAVTALIVGAPAKVSRMVDALWEGPAAASVRHVAVGPADGGAARPGRFTIEATPG